MKIGVTNFAGASGNSYEFEVHSIDAPLGEGGAVYIFVFQATLEFDFAILGYGSVDKLGGQLLDFKDWQELQTKNLNCICVRLIADAAERAKVIEDLQGAFDAPFFAPVDGSK